MSEMQGGSVLWRATTSRHDWRGGAPLTRLLEAAAALQLFGAPGEARVVRGRVGNLVGKAPEALASAILAAKPDRSGVVEIHLRGEAPAAWELSWNVYSFDAGSGWVDGMNSLWFRFDRSRVVGRGASDALLTAFLSVEDSVDTEYAVLHPYEHWSSFADPDYDTAPITNGLQFKGVFWANFLGPGHLDEFDLAQLRRLEAHSLRWLDERGLFVIAAPDLDAADTPEAEAELVRLTQAFRAALRPDSRFS